MVSKVTSRWQVLDHGRDTPDYFPGCGTHGTTFDHVVTGVGSTLRGALEDALDQVMDHARVADALEDECKALWSQDTSDAGGGDVSRFVSVRFCVAGGAAC